MDIFLLIPDCLFHLTPEPLKSPLSWDGSLYNFNTDGAGELSCQEFLQVGMEPFNPNCFCLYDIHLELVLPTLPDNYRELSDYLFPEDEQPPEPNNITYVYN